MSNKSDKVYSVHDLIKVLIMYVKEKRTDEIPYDEFHKEVIKGLEY
jgi:hypothetical protein